MSLRPFLAFLLSVSLAAAAPMTMKEVAFLVRQRTPEADILREVQQRRLLTAIDATTEAGLRESGASAGLLATLKTPGLALSSADAHAETKRLAVSQRLAIEGAKNDAVAFAALQQRRAEGTMRLLNAGAVASVLNGKLVRLDGDEMKAFTPNLSQTRIFALYYSAGWCEPCRDFTPRLVEAYRLLQQQHAGTFELIMVGSDREASGMLDYMRTNRMPWPAVRFGVEDERLTRYAGEGVPHLVLVSASGEALSRNIKTKEGMTPQEIATAISQVVERVR